MAKQENPADSQKIIVVAEMLVQENEFLGRFSFNRINAHLQNAAVFRARAELEKDGTMTFLRADPSERE